MRGYIPINSLCQRNDHTMTPDEGSALLRHLLSRCLLIGLNCHMTTRLSRFPCPAYLYRILIETACKINVQWTTRMSAGS